MKLFKQPLFYTSILSLIALGLIIGNYAFGDDWRTPTSIPPLGNVSLTSSYESTIATGTASQYWRGDKTWQTLPPDTDTWITTQTCSTDYALQSVGKESKTCINKVDYSDIAYDVSCTNCLTNTEVASADVASDLSCTDCIGTTEIADSYVLNTGDAMTGALAITGTVTATQFEGGGAGITGVTATNADTLDGAQPSMVAGNSTIVQRNASGYVFANYFNTTAGVTATAASHFAIQTASDGFIRWQTPANAKISIGLGSVDNTADSAKSVLYAATAGSAGNASTATNVAWTGVTGKPTLPSSQEGSRYTTDFNTILSTGFFNAEGTPANSPGGSYGQLIAARGVDTGLQIYGGYNTDNLWFRGWWSSGAGFGAWRTVIHSGNINSQSVNYAATAGNADTVDSHHFNWSGQGGQPTWLWGGNDSANMYVYNPSNFSVSYAATAGNASPTTWTCAIVHGTCAKPRATATCGAGYRLISGSCTQWSDATCTGSITGPGIFAQLGTLDGVSWTCLGGAVPYIDAIAYCCK